MDVDEQSQNVKEGKLEESVVDVSPSGFSAPINADTKATEDEEMDTFLIGQHKKSVGEEIRHPYTSETVAIVDSNPSCDIEYSQL